MGRGSYLGGHTVVGPRSGWFTGVGKRDAPTPGNNRKGAKPSLTVMKVNYLHQVIAAELRGQPVPPIPKRHQSKLEPLISAAGGPLLWARSMPEYESFKAKKQKKLNNGTEGERRPPTEPKNKLASSEPNPRRFRAVVDLNPRRALQDMRHVHSLLMRLAKDNRPVAVRLTVEIDAEYAHGIERKMQRAVEGETALRFRDYRFE